MKGHGHIQRFQKDISFLEVPMKTPTRDTEKEK
jgi:hypothetical protein